VAFIHGAAGLGQFTDEAVSEPAVLELRSKVTIKEDPSMGVEEAYVNVRTSSGVTYTKHIPYLRGSLQCPMTDAELEAKFLDQAAFGRSGCDAKKLIDDIWRVEDLDDVAELMRRMAPVRL
jgi:2-methylcitrate dehydratase PrpD